jgi:Stigma-specific protein, Stig1
MILLSRWSARCALARASSVALAVSLSACSGLTQSSLSIAGDAGEDARDSGEDVARMDTSPPSTDARPVMSADTGGCGVGQLSCGGVCVDPAVDVDNCGRCGNPCGAGLACSAGACACPAGLLLCGAACVDVTTDPANCGMCAHSCAGTTCVASTCTPPAVTCTLENNDDCTPGDTTSCCAPGGGDSCGSTETMFGTSTTSATFENLCCVGAGGACDNVSVVACCGYMTCNGATCECQEQGHHCVNDGDCCDGTCTAKHICGQMCVAAGIECELGDSCCGDTFMAACPASGSC